MQGREYASLACSTPQFVSLTSLLLLPKPTMSIYARRRRDTTTTCSVFMRATAYSFFLSLSFSFASFTHPFDVPHPSSNFTIRVAEAIRASTTICCWRLFWISPGQDLCSSRYEMGLPWHWPLLLLTFVLSSYYSCTSTTSIFQQVFITPCSWCHKLSSWCYLVQYTDCPLRHNGTTSPILVHSRVLTSSFNWAQISISSIFLSFKFIIDKHTKHSVILTCNRPIWLDGTFRDY